MLKMLKKELIRKKYFCIFIIFRKNLFIFVAQISKLISNTLKK